MLMDAAQDALRALDRERDEMRERLEVMDGYSRTLEAVGRLVTENRELQEQVDDLQQQLDNEKQQRAELEMKLMEMNKLSTGMAKKVSEDNLLKALRTYVNRSKRKTSDKRAFAKSASLEIANANGLDLPEDLKTAIDSLDDELSEPKMVNVAGDLVLEKKVDHEIGVIGDGGVGVNLNQ